MQRVLPTGEKFYAEQTSHHPPITNFQLVGPNREYEYSGFFEYKAWPTGLSSLAGTRVGKQIITFNDGGLISIRDPQLELTGLTYGERVHNYIGSAVIRDHINMIEAEIAYNPPQATSGGMFSSLTNKIFGGSKPLTDSICVTIF